MQERQPDTPRPSFNRYTSFTHLSDASINSVQLPAHSNQQPTPNQANARQASNCNNAYLFIPMLSFVMSLFFTACFPELQAQEETWIQKSLPSPFNQFTAYGLNILISVTLGLVMSIMMYCRAHNNQSSQQAFRSDYMSVDEDNASQNEDTTFIPVRRNS